MLHCYFEVFRQAGGRTVLTLAPHYHYLRKWVDTLVTIPLLRASALEYRPFDDVIQALSDAVDEAIANVTAALQTDYGTLRVEQCAGFNFDTLLMEVCL